MEPITFTYTPIKDDYVVPLRSLFMRRPMFVRQILLFGLLALFALGLSSLGGISMLLPGGGSDEAIVRIIRLALPLFCATIFSIVPALYLLAIPASGGRMFKKNERLRADATWTFDDEQICIATRFEEHKLDWSNFKEVAETKKYYLLMSRLSEAAAQTLPKRAFTSPEQEQAFRELVERKLGPIKK